MALSFVLDENTLRVIMEIIDASQKENPGELRAVRFFVEIVQDGIGFEVFNRQAEIGLLSEFSTIASLEKIC